MDIFNPFTGKPILSITRSGGVSQRAIVHKDKVRPSEVWKIMGGQELMQQSEKYFFDLFGQEYNANVFVCTRAITDAIVSLPVRIVTTEIVNGQETVMPDNDHEANDFLRHPNPKNTFRQIIKHNSMSLLGNGNAFNTIELVTGPNHRLEAWPRDPREVDYKPSTDQYIFGKNTPHMTKAYKSDRVIHIAETDVTETIFGKPRHNAVRAEMRMDMLVNRFNERFFEAGGTLGMMFTPDQNLTEDQHSQLVEALSAQTQGVEKAWALFVNMFAGKLESPDQKHKDISFLELLQHNREKIYSAFGLPPFRGGIMEYANYANALAQDADFWLNTIKPLTTQMQDAYNKQLIWPFFGDDVSLLISFDEIPALRGDPKSQAAVHKIYIETATMTTDEVREELGRSPMTEEEEEDARGLAQRLKTRAIAESKGDDNDDADADANGDDDNAGGSSGGSDKDDKKKSKSKSKADKSDKEEENSLSLTLYRALRKQRVSAVKLSREYTVDGRLMSRYWQPERESAMLLNVTDETHRLDRLVVPSLKHNLRQRIMHSLRDVGSREVFSIDGRDGRRIVRLLVNELRKFNEETETRLKAVIGDCVRYSWTQTELHRSFAKEFTYTRAMEQSSILMSLLQQQGDALVHELRLREQDRDFKRKGINLNGKKEKKEAVQ